MSHEDGPPPIFEGDDFPYWKIRMEAYLEALDIGILRAASQGFPKPQDATHLQGDEMNYEKWRPGRDVVWVLVGERIKMPKRGVNWANSKFLYNN